MSIQEKVLGPKHPDLASGLMNLGDVVWAMGDATAAKPYYARAVAILEEASPGNPELARFLDRLARVTLKQGGAERRGASTSGPSPCVKRPSGRSTTRWLRASPASPTPLVGRPARKRRRRSTSGRSRSFRRPDGGYYRGATDALDGYVAVLRATGQKERADEMEALAAQLRKQDS